MKKIHKLTTLETLCCFGLPIGGLFICLIFIQNEQRDTDNPPQTEEHKVLLIYE